MPSFRSLVSDSLILVGSGDNPTDISICLNLCVVYVLVRHLDAVGDSRVGLSADLPIVAGSKTGPLQNFFALRALFMSP